MNLLKNVLLFLLGLLLLWLALRNLPLADLRHQLVKARYWPLVPVMGATLFGYWMRIRRWRLLYRNLSENVSARSQWVALCAGYLVSLGFPRAGEITRCLIMKRYNGTPVNRSLATVIIERITDIIVLAGLVAAITLLNLGNAAAFFLSNIVRPVYERTGPLLLVIVAVAGLAGAAALLIYLRNKQKGRNWLEDFLIALKRLLGLHNKLLFGAYTTGIWLSYFLMTYLWIFAFDESTSLPWLHVFIIMVVGTIGKSLPIQGGGVGAYHYAVAQVCLFFGVSLVTGNALAIIIHGAQMVYTILTGSMAYLVLMIDEKKRTFAG